MNKETITIYYDDACIFCRWYSTYVQLQKKYTLTCLDARSVPKEIETFAQQGYDSNTGIIVQHGSHIIHGAEAILYIQYLLTKKQIYRNKYIIYLGKPLYTCINYLRTLFLFIQKIPPIHKK